MTREAYLWLLPDRRLVLLTDDPGPPVGGRLAGIYPLPDEGWGKAGEVARAKAKDYGYEIEYDCPLTGPA